MKDRSTLFSKQQILDEIKRTANENDGVALGQKAIARETGIHEFDWRGRYWTSWSEALAEAGFGPNTWTARIDDDRILEALALEVRRLRSFPTRAQLMIKRRQDPTFPSETSFRRRGSKAELIRQLTSFCELDRDKYADVLEILHPLAAARLDRAAQPKSDSDGQVIGHVYLLQVGRHYKIGRSNAFGRRERELAIQMPERATTVHVINTDDPVGIEAYWHRRFADRRLRPDAEWFALTQEDIRAFKRRKFQ